VSYGHTNKFVNTHSNNLILIFKPPIYVVFYAIRALSQSRFVFIKNNIHIPGSY